MNHHTVLVEMQLALGILHLVTLDLSTHGPSRLQLHCAIDGYNSGSHFTGPLKRLNEKTNTCNVLITGLIRYLISSP